MNRFMYAAKASQNLGLDRSVIFPGRFSVAISMYPWPQRRAGLVEEGLQGTVRRNVWRPDPRLYDERGVEHIV